MLPNKVKTSICLRKDGGCEPTFTVETAISTNVDEVVKFLILHQSDYINAFFNVTIVFSSGMYVHTQSSGQARRRRNTFAVL